MILSYCYIEPCTNRLEREKALSEAGRALLGKMLSDKGIVDYKIERDEKGRPFLSTHPQVDFNIAHSGDIAVCILSVGEGRVGVDVEKIFSDMPAERQERFLERFFQNSEREMGLSLAWTRKEAYLKYLSVGLNTELRSVDPGKDDSVRLDSFTVGEYNVTVCTKRDASMLVVCAEK